MIDGTRRDRHESSGDGWHRHAGTAGRSAAARSGISGTRPEPGQPRRHAGHRIRYWRPRDRRGNPIRSRWSRDHHPLLRAAAKGDDDKLATSCAPPRTPVPGTSYSSRSSAPSRIPITSAVDRAMFGYSGSKLAAERVVADSGVPWTTLRATQFHDLILKAARPMARLPVLPVPTGFRFQPVDTAEVADRLVALALRYASRLGP